MKVTRKEGQFCSKESIKLIETSKRSLVFVYFDKPVYKGGDDFKFRIFVLDQKLIPLENHKISEIRISDSKGNIIRKLKNAQTFKHGVYEDVLKIAKAPNMGRWNVQATINGRNISKTFLVHVPESENFQVLLNVPKVVAFVDRKFTLQINVNNRDEKFFSGVAKVKVFGRFVGEENIILNQPVHGEIKIVRGKASLVVDFEEDLGFTYPTVDMLLTFYVEVIKDVTKETAEVTRQILMRHKGRNEIEIIRKKYFKPTFDFPIKIRVKTVDGRPDNSFNQLLIIEKYQNKNEDGKLEITPTSRRVNLKNGETVARLKPIAETMKITIQLKFGESELTEIIERLPTYGTDEYMQATFTNKR